MKKIIIVLSLLLSMSAVAGISYSKTDFNDGTVQYENIRIEVAGIVHYLGYIFTSMDNANEFCKSQGFEESFTSLNKTMSSSDYATFSMFGSNDQSSNIKLYRSNKYDRFTRVICGNKISPDFKFEILKHN